MQVAVMPSADWRACLFWLFNCLFRFFFHVLCAAVGLPATDEAALLRLGLVAGADPVAFTRRHLRHLGMGGGVGGIKTQS